MHPRGWAGAAFDWRLVGSVNRRPDRRCDPVDLAISCAEGTACRKSRDIRNARQLGAHAGLSFDVVRSHSQGDDLAVGVTLRDDADP